MKKLLDFSSSNKHCLHTTRNGCVYLSIHYYLPNGFRGKGGLKLLPRKNASGYILYRGNELISPGKNGVRTAPRNVVSVMTDMQYVCTL